MNLHCNKTGVVLAKAQRTNHFFHILIFLTMICKKGPKKIQYKKHFFFAIFAALREYP